MNEDRLRVTVADGKYTVVQTHRGTIFAYRNKDIWRDCTGDKLILSLAQEIEELRQQNAELMARLSKRPDPALRVASLESGPELKDGSDFAARIDVDATLNVSDGFMRGMR